ncbi:hypothetical protein ACGF0J_20735 [Nonomuraea sp. NPDC047897]|uniref:hypothetical protein n=1 Tax=Nonomuraea sp. NPDC047897 TaxID=3364346 RepID=UPI003721000D
MTAITGLNAPSMIRLRTSPGSAMSAAVSRLTLRDHAGRRKVSPFRRHHQEGRERAQVRAAAQPGERGNGEPCPDQDLARDKQEIHDPDIS